MNFKTLRRTLLQDLHTWGREKKKHHIRGTIQLAFLPSVGKEAPGRNQKFGPIKEVFQGCNVLVAPSFPRYALPLLRRVPLKQALTCDFYIQKINKSAKLNKTAHCRCCCDRHTGHA